MILLIRALVFFRVTRCDWCDACISWTYDTYVLAFESPMSVCLCTACICVCVHGVLPSNCCSAHACVCVCYSPPQEVAVKKLVGGGGGPMEKTLKDFKTECVLLSRLKHRNIIALVGATTHPVTCVMQYCSRGNLMVLLDDRRCVICVCVRVVSLCLCVCVRVPVCLLCDDTYSTRSAF